MEINAEQLENKIENGEKLIIDFWAPWCRPCGIMKPTFEKVSEEMLKNNSEVQLYTINMDENREIAVKLGIRAIPTIKSFSNGKELSSQSGVLMETQIKDLVNNLLING
jgi:thioredoxin